MGRVAAGGVGVEHFPCFCQRFWREAGAGIGHADAQITPLPGNGQGYRAAAGRWVRGVPLRP